MVSGDSDDITKILTCFNKLTKSNFDAISEEIGKYHIIDYSELKNLVTSIYNKCINNKQFVVVNIELLKKNHEEFHNK